MVLKWGIICGQPKISLRTTRKSVLNTKFTFLKSIIATEARTIGIKFWRGETVTEMNLESATTSTTRPFASSGRGLEAVNMNLAQTEGCCQRTEILTKFSVDMQRSNKNQDWRA